MTAWPSSKSQPRSRSRKRGNVSGDLARARVELPARLEEIGRLEALLGEARSRHAAVAESLTRLQAIEVPDDLETLDTDMAAAAKHLESLEKELAGAVEMAKAIEADVAGHPELAESRIGQDRPAPAP